MKVSVMETRGTTPSQEILLFLDGKPCAVKVARTVWVGGKVPVTYLSTFLTKAPENQLEKTIIADLVFQPLYITSEVTNGLQKNYVRSRTLVHVCRTDGIACVEIQGTQGILGI